MFVAFDIFADELPERTEAAQVRLSLPTDGMFPGFETLPQYPEFFIIIEDDDGRFGAFKYYKLAHSCYICR